MKRYKPLILVLAGALLAGCATNGSSISPSVTQANLNQNVLQFAVGTANYGPGGIVALNTVVTFRQPNGNSATLLNTPTITGPATFVVPSVASAGTDAGTNHISATPQQAAPSPAPPATTFGQSGGAFSYGFAPFNSSTTGAALYPGSPPLYSQPFYASSGKLAFYGGPPAYPFFNDGTYPAGFLGYSQGFTMFAATPVLGTYSLSVLVPAANAPQTTLTASASLTNSAPLPALTTPTFVQNAGGASGTVTVPSDPRINETLVYVVNRTAGTYFTVGPFKRSGAFNYTLPGNLGPCGGTGCQTTSSAGATFATGNSYRVFAISYSYPAYEASAPISKSATPVITGANGQADISVSPTVVGTY